MDLDQLNNPDFWGEKSTDEKEENSLELIEYALSEYNKPVVACSWGKDSLVVLHMVKRVCNKLNKNFDVLWNNTTIHYPSVYHIKNELEEKWELNVVETKPDKTFKDIVENFGFPGVNNSDRKDTANQACCYYIKKKPTKQAIKNNDWGLYFDGLTAYESDRRYMNMKEYGVVHQHKTFDLIKCHPIAWWVVEEVWEYIEKNKIPYPDVYDYEVDEYTKKGYTLYQQGHRFERAIRNGCWCCPLVLTRTPSRMKQLRLYYPKLWEFLMKDMGLAEEIAKIKLGGQGDLFDGYFEENEDYWLEKRPCFFDKL